MFVNNLAQEWLGNLICFFAFVEVLNSRIIHIRIGKLTVLRRLTNLPEGLLATELLDIFIHDFLLGTLVIILSLL